MILLRESIVLSADTILQSVETVSQRYGEVMGKRAVSETRIRLIAEELLLNCKAMAGEGAGCLLVLKKEFGSLRLELTTHGAEFDPNGSKGELCSYEGFSHQILQRFNVVPKYEHSSREGGINKVSISLEKKPPKNLFLYFMISALGLAIGAYYLLNAFFGAGTVAAVGDITVLLFDKLTKLIAGIATPLVFFAVLTGIMGLGDANTFGRVGTVTLKEMMLTYLLAGILFGTLGGIFYYTGNQQAAETGNVLTQLTTLVLDMVPTNIVEPFLNGNDLQVVTLSVFCGFVFLLISKSMPIIGKVCFEFSSFFNKMMGLVCKLLPAVVFLGIFNMLVSDSFAKIASIYKMFLLFFLVCSLIVIVLTLKTRIVTKAPLKTILKHQLPAFLITLTTSSQVAAIPENMSCLKEKYGVESDFVDFALPLCVVTYMPCGAVFSGLTVLAAGELAGVAVTLPTLIKVVIVSIVVAIAAPPIPGSAFAVMPICFSACGVPNDVYPIAIVIGTIIGYFLPALNCYCLQHKILVTGYRLGKVNTEILRRKQ